MSDEQFQQLTPLIERFVLSFEKIAASLDGLNDTYRKRFEKPDRPVRPAVVTRVPTEEDKIKEVHGASSEPLGQWLSDLESEEEVGVREQEWLDRDAAKEKERYARAQGTGEG